jgi:hypothetical protein
MTVKISASSLIEKGTVFHCELETVNRDGTPYKGNRFLIVLNVNPKTDQVLILVTITTKIEKQEKFIKSRGEDADTLVKISPSDYRYLSGESAVNCNNTYERTLSDLTGKIENGGKIFSEKVPKNILDALVSGVLKSKQVPDSQKKLII